MKKDTKVALVAWSVITLAIIVIIVVLVILFSKDKFKKSSSATSISSTASSQEQVTSSAEETSSGSAVTQNRFAYFPDRTNGIISGYQINTSSGFLTPTIPYSTITAPSSLAASHDKQFLFAADFTDNSIVSFNIDPDNGSLSLVGALDLTGKSVLNNVLSHPTLPTIYVTSGGTDEILIIDYDNSGTLTLRDSVATGSNPMCLTTDSAGTYLFVGGSQYVNVFMISIDGGLTSVYVHDSGTSDVVTCLTLDNTDSYLYGSWYTTPGLFVAKVASGALQDVSQDPVNGTNTITCLKPSPDNTLMYAIEWFSNQMHIYDIDSTTGILTETEDSPVTRDGIYLVQYWDTFAYLVPNTSDYSDVSVTMRVDFVYQGKIDYAADNYTYDQYPLNATQMLVV